LGEVSQAPFPLNKDLVNLLLSFLMPFEVPNPHESVEWIGRLNQLRAMKQRCEAEMERIRQMLASPNLDMADRIQNAERLAALKRTWDALDAEEVRTKGDAENDVDKRRN
jgi:hypothetical protein